MGNTNIPTRSSSFTSIDESPVLIILLSVFVLSLVSHVPCLQHCKLIKNTQHSFCCKNICCAPVQRGPWFVSSCLWLSVKYKGNINLLHPNQIKPIKYSLFLSSKQFLSQLLSLNHSKSYTNSIPSISHSSLIKYYNSCKIIVSMLVHLDWDSNSARWLKLWETSLMCETFCITTFPTCFVGQEGKTTKHPARTRVTDCEINLADTC